MCPVNCHLTYFLFISVLKCPTAGKRPPCPFFRHLSQWRACSCHPNIYVFLNIIKKPNYFINLQFYNRRKLKTIASNWNIKFASDESKTGKNVNSVPAELWTLPISTCDQRLITWNYASGFTGLKVTLVQRSALELRQHDLCAKITRTAPTSKGKWNTRQISIPF